MKMVCKKNSLFVVSIYYDMRGQSIISPEDTDKLSRLLQMIEIEFQMKYGGIYLEQQPIIATLDSAHVSLEPPPPPLTDASGDPGEGSERILLSFPPHHPLDDSELLPWGGGSIDIDP
jgi:hypothetical protein